MIDYVIMAILAFCAVYTVTILMQIPGILWKSFRAYYQTTVSARDAVKAGRIVYEKLNDEQRAATQAIVVQEKQDGQTE